MIIGNASGAQLKAALEAAKNLEYNKTDGLPYNTFLKVGGEYFVTTNVDVTEGLFNGSSGTLKHIDYGTTKSGKRIPKTAWIDFRNPLVGKSKKSITKRHNRNRPNIIQLDWIPIERTKRKLTKTKDYRGLVLGTIRCCSNKVTQGMLLKVDDNPFIKSRRSKQDLSYPAIALVVDSHCRLNKTS